MRCVCTHTVWWERNERKISGNLLVYMYRENVSHLRVRSGLSWITLLLSLLPGMKTISQFRPYYIGYVTMYTTYGDIGLVVSANLGTWLHMGLSMHCGHYVQSVYIGSTLPKCMNNSFQCHPNIGKMTELTPNLGIISKLGHLQQARNLSRVDHTSVRYAMFGILMINNILLLEEESLMSNIPTGTHLVAQPSIGTRCGKRKHTELIHR